MILTDVPFEVGGKKVILTIDEIGNESIFGDDAVQLEGPTDAHSPVWASNTRIAELRGESPGIKVYGVWQVLLHNKLVGLENGVYTLVIASGAGLYAHVANGYIQSSGQYVGDLPLHLVSEQVFEIALPELRALKLPTTPARTFEELIAADRSRDKRSWAMTGMIVLAVLGGGVLIETALTVKRKADAEEVKKIGASAQQLETEAAVLASKKNPITDSLRTQEHAALTRLAEITFLANGMIMDGTAIDSGTAKAIVASLNGKPSFPVKISGRQDGRMEIEWSVDGAADKGVP